MAQDLVAALGARLEARLRAQEARFKSVEDTVRTQVLAQTPVLFSIPESLHFTSDQTRAKGDDPALTPASSPATGFDIGSTFRRKGVLSDVPMAVSRVENGMVFATFVDGEGSHEMAFDPKQLDLVESALSSAVQATVSAHVTANAIAPGAPSVPAEVAAVAIDPVVASTATASPDATASLSEAKAAVSVPATTPALNENTVAASIARAMAPAVSTVAESIARAMAPAVVNTPPAANTSAAAPGVVRAAASANGHVAASVLANTAAAVASVAATSANTTASITLPDGTQQFQYAPTGSTGVINPPAAYTPAVPASFGEGATFRRKGVGADIPMTVTRVGNGMIFANYTDSEGTREMAFVPNQLDLVTAAP